MSIRDSERQLERTIRSAIGEEIRATRIGGSDWCITGRKDSVNAAVEYLEVTGIMLKADAEPNPDHYDPDNFLAYMRPRD